MGVQVSLGREAPFEYVHPRGSCGSLSCNVLRNFHIDSHGCTSSCSLQWSTVGSFPSFPVSSQHLVASISLRTAMLTKAECNLKVILVCISLMAKKIEHIKNKNKQIKTLIGFCVSSLKFLWISLAHLLMGSCTFWLCNMDSGFGHLSGTELADFLLFCELYVHSAHNFLCHADISLHRAHFLIFETTSYADKCVGISLCHIFSFI